MKALLLLAMFLISTTAFSQQTDGWENEMPTVKGNSVVVMSDSLISHQSNAVDHAALAKIYKDKSRKFGIAALILVAVSIGTTWYGVATYEFDFDFSGLTWDKMNTGGRPYTRSSGSDSGSSVDNTLSNAMITVGVISFVSSVICCVKSIIYHNKSGTELKLSVKGTSASLTFVF